MDKVEKLILASLGDFMNLPCINSDKDERGSKLVFPKKRDGKRRVSEQEARFLFLLHVEQNSDYFYSLETPTEEEYSFSGSGSRSGNIDVCLYENEERKHLIEFKALNPKLDALSKDFEKLFRDAPSLNNFFVHVLENKIEGDFKNTVASIEEKYRVAISNAQAKYQGIQFSRVKIFLCIIETKEISQYEVDISGNLKRQI